MEDKEIYDYILKIQAIAKTGLVYSKDPYAITNYQQINALSMEMLENFMSVKFDRPNFFQRDTYPTPAVSVRVVILNDNRDKVLMVREVATQNYSLPGGWCDLYDTASQTAVNESSQEAGADIEVMRLVAVLNRTPFKSQGTIPEYVIVFEGKVQGKLHEHEYETDDVSWFPVDNLPEISRKLTMSELQKVLKAAVNKETIFD